jgi:PleD family two-component response regulator
VVSDSQRTRVILIGGDAHRLRSLRMFLDQLGVFEPVAIATGGAGLNALARPPWGCAVVIDDLHDMLPEQVILAARDRQARVPFVGIVLNSERTRVSAMYEAGVVEVVYMGSTPTSELARAIVRAMERQQLLERIETLEAEIVKRKVVDEETNLYPTWRFDEDWRLEQIRARRRGGDLSVLSIRLDTAPELYLLSPRDRLTALRQAARAIKGVLREGDLACHDGSGVFRVMLVDGGSGTAAETSGAIAQAVRQAFAQSSISAHALVTVEESFERQPSFR